jgi:pantetheine-phosphate adenylyltransferase
MTTDPEYFVLRSSSIKELASFHGDTTGMVPPLVTEALKEKYK